MSGRKTPVAGFPEVVYVHVENPDTRDEYLAVSKTPDAADDGAAVAIYERRDVKTMRVTRRLESVRR